MTDAAIIIVYVAGCSAIGALIGAAAGFVCAALFRIKRHG